ncbi:MAG: ATP-dependent helicase [Actinomycetota bacterium]
MSHDQLLDDLDARQRAAVTSPGAPLAILAPAGSGKTRVLTRRIAWRIREGRADGNHVLAVTFTRKAAGELVDRLRGARVAGVTAGTFHALALAQLRRHTAEQGGEPPVVVASRTRILAPLVRGSGLRRALADIAAEIGWAKARRYTPEQYADAARAHDRRPPGTLGDMATIYARYEAEKRRQRTCDFDDLLGRCADAIERDEVFAAAQRWRFRHLFVDEFQDATPLQVRLLRAWLGDRDDLCVVGDVAQAIYGFAGADATPLREFATWFPGATVVALDRNYRSTPQVVAISESVLGPAAGVERPPAHAVRAEGGAPRARAYDDEGAEAAAVAQGLWQAFTDGITWSQMAVLFRTNAQSAPFEAACARRGIPYRMPGTDRFADRAVVRLLLEELRAAERAAPGRPFTDHLADLATEELPPAEETQELRAHRDALVHLGREYLAADGASGNLSGFVAWLDLATRGDTSGRDGVDLLTFHRAKGLEWAVVFVTGIERGLVPIATDPGGVAEERRLLHVALSRPRDELHLTWARARTIGGRGREREPSPWLAALEVAAAALRGRPADPRAGVIDARAVLAAAEPPAPVSRARRHHR